MSRRIIEEEIFISFQGHNVDKVIRKVEELKTYPTIIKGGLTLILQLLDVSIKAF